MTGGIGFAALGSRNTFGCLIVKGLLDSSPQFDSIVSAHNPERR
jgi:hypothetical protein